MNSLENIVSDLPEPSRPVYSVADRRQRQWHLTVTAYSFVTFYALIHKLFVPAFLKFTALRGSSYSKIDFWFLHCLILLKVLHGYPLNDPALSFFCGGGIAYGAVEVIELLMGRLSGWLMISRMLSSLPIATLCVLILVQRKAYRSERLAWTGAIMTVLYFAFQIWRSHGV